MNNLGKEKGLLRKRVMTPAFSLLWGLLLPGLNGSGDRVGA